LPETPAGDAEPVPSTSAARGDEAATVDPAVTRGRVTPAAQALPTKSWQPRVYRPRRWLRFIVAAAAAAALTVGLLVLVGHR